MLKEKFGNEYLDYKQSVPSVFPKIIPYRKYEQWKFSFSRLIRSKEHKAIVWIIILIIIIHLKEEFVIEHKSVDEKTLYLIIISIVFWLADTIEGYIRSQRKEA
jgi:hypothetical protein